MGAAPAATTDAVVLQSLYEHYRDPDQVRCSNHLQPLHCIRWCASPPPDTCKPPHKYNLLTSIYWYRAAQDIILAEGVERICADIGVEPADVVTLVVSYFMKAANMGEFTHDEFITGMRAMGCDTAAKLKDKIPQLRQMLSEEGALRVS